MAYSATRRAAHRPSSPAGRRSLHSDSDAQTSTGSQDFWCQRAGRRLCAEDIRQISENVCGFFRTLAEWDQKERSAPSDQRLSRRPNRDRERP